MLVVYSVDLRLIQDRKCLIWMQLEESQLLIKARIK